MLWLLLILILLLLVVGSVTLTDLLWIAVVALLVVLLYRWLRGNQSGRI